MHDNDKTIFKYLNPIDNDMFGSFNKSDIDCILYYLNRYYLEYRKKLNIDKNITFGIEIEMEHFKGQIDNFWPFQLELNKVVDNDKWEVRNDISLNWGREIVSDILVDDENTWKEIRNVCNFVSKYGEIDVNCSSHVHVGSQIFGNNTLYWYRFFKLWSIYENIIYRFSYGEYLYHRPKINRYSKCSANFFNNILANENILEMDFYKMLLFIREHIKSEESLKNYSISVWHMLCDNDYNRYDNYNNINRYCTVEYRCSNGTLDEVIWQNYVNFIIKMMLYCKSDKYDDDLINRRKCVNIDIFDDLEEYSKIYIEQAIEFSDMIFDNNLDKIYFLRQYIKSFDTSYRFVKTRKFTVNK